MWDFLGNSIEDGVVTGIPFTLAFLGVWFVFRLQNDFDLTVDGTFALGGAVAGAWIVRGGDPWVGLVLAAGVGGLGGCATYVIMRLLRLPLVLTSIVVGLGLLSVALWTMGQPNLSLIDTSTVFSMWSDWTGLEPRSTSAIVTLGVVLVGAAYFVVWWFLRSELGLALRASGLNRAMARTVGVSPGGMLLLAIVVGNALAATGGALLAQEQGFADVSMGVGTILFGVTAILLGEVLSGGFHPGRVWVLTVLGGTLLYRSLLAGAFRAGIPSQYFQGLTAAIVLGAIAVGRLNLLKAGRGLTRSVSTRLLGGRNADAPAEGDGG